MTGQPSGQFLIRPAQVADVDRIAAFQVALAFETEEHTLDAETVRDGVAAVLSRDVGAAYLVAVVDGEPIASLMTTSEWSDWRNGRLVWLQSVYVLPVHRRRGVFARMFETVLADCERDPEVVGIRLYHEVRNERAIATYRRLGMTSPGYGVMERLFDRSSVGAGGP